MSSKKNMLSRRYRDEFLKTLPLPRWIFKKSTAAAMNFWKIYRCRDEFLKNLSLPRRCRDEF